jgi:uncharacterized protein
MDQFIIIALISLMIGLSKGGLGGPVLVPLITPILSQIMPAPQAVAIVLPLLLLGDIFALRMYWKKWDVHHIRLLLPTAIAGVILGTIALWLLTVRPDDTFLRRIIGVFTLMVVIYRLIGGKLKTRRYQPRPWHGYIAGTAAGFGSALANVGAPPFTAYMLMQETSPEVFVGTATLFFAAVNAAKLPGILIIGVLDFQLFLNIAWSALLIPVGVLLGRWFTLRVNSKIFEWSMILLLSWLSVLLLFSTPR